MTNRTPPKLATALLKWFGPDGPALAGDLLERYQLGASRWWYWRQVVTAIATANGRALILRGVVVGWMTLWTFRWATNDLNREFSDAALDWLIVHLGSNPVVMMWALWWTIPQRVVGYVLCGWMVARLHPTCRSMAVFTFMATVLVLSAWREATVVRIQWQLYGHQMDPMLTLVSGALPLVILFGGLASGHRVIRATA
jgi:hypothetical protein